MPARRVALAGASYANDDAVVVDFASAPDEISGADVVVVRASDGDKWGELVRDRAPNAVVIVIGDSPHAMCEATLFPRARIIGVADDSEVGPVVDAIVYDRESEFETIVRCQGERGLEDEFARVPVRIGAGGVIEIIES
jgi:malate/lactate dehydrogenase